MQDDIKLTLSQYQAGNLRWLLRVVYEGDDAYNEKVGKEGPHVRAMGLHNGDWNAEVLWNLEQLMIDSGMEKGANAQDIWPLDGWHNGRTTKQAEIDSKGYAHCRLCMFKVDSEEELRKLPMSGLTFKCPKCNTYIVLTATE